MDTISHLSYWYNLIETYLVIGFTWLIDNFREFAWVVRVAAISLTISVLLIAISSLRIFHNARQRRKWRKTEKKLNERFGEGIAYVLSPEASSTMTREQIMELLHLDPDTHDPKTIFKDYRENLSMARIIYRSRISDEAKVAGSRNLHILLGLFNTKEFLEEVIVKDKLHMKVEALHMLRSFKTPTNQWIANQLFNSKRKRVQRLAMYASIMSSSNTDLEYFESDFFDDNFCLYDEIQLGFVLQRRQSMKRKIPNLAHWAHLQKNPETQCVFVRLMRQFNQAEYCNELEEFFAHDSDSELIEEIARTWGYLRYTEGEELMRDMLLTQPDSGKVAIMHALARINSGESLQTFVDSYKNSGTLFVRYEALRCIYLYGDIGRAQFEELRAEATPGDLKLFEFFDNELTKEEIPLEKTAKYFAEYGDNLYAVG